MFTLKTKRATTPEKANALFDDEIYLDTNDLAQATYPLYVCAGSVTGASRADVWAVVENLIQTQCTTPSIVKALLFKDPKDKTRWIYEIHEGGNGISLLHAFDVSAEPLYVRLADNRITVIEEAAGEIVTLTHTHRPDLHAKAVDIPSTGKRLKPYISDDTPLLKTGKTVLGVGILSLFVSYGVALALSAGMGLGVVANPYINPSPTAIHEEIATALSAARSDLLKKEDPFAYVGKIEKTNGRWSHELASLKVKVDDFPQEATDEQIVAAKIASAPRPQAAPAPNARAQTAPAPTQNTRPQRTAPQPTPARGN